MLRKIFTFALLLCALITSQRTEAALYACGSFQGWNPVDAWQFTQDADGIYHLDIDFSSDTNFKISTVKPTSHNTQQAWSEFDSGALQPTEGCALNLAVQITSGVNNINAPEYRTLTVMVNLATMQMAFSDGTTQIQWSEDIVIPGPGPDPDPDPTPGIGFYACGSWQGWNPSEAEAFTLGSDGLYRLTIDFSAGRYFKMSTVKPDPADVGTMWAAFDQGAFQQESATTINRAVAIVPGVDNCEAPAERVLTVVINTAMGKMAYTDGIGKIDWNAAAPDPTKPWSGTLPVLHIDTEGHSPVVSKETYLKGTYYLDPMGVEGVEAFGSADAPLPLQIKGRGNFTWTGFDKKPYRLKLDTKAALMGMKKSKHFVLLAHADDYRGFLRNTVGFELARRAGLEWTPGDQPVEVVLNGEYIGLYFLTENIRVDKDRVNIFEQPDGDKSTDVTGGWLVEIDNYDTDPHVSLSSVNGYQMWFTYKTPEVVNEDQYQYLYDEMYDIDRAVFASDKSHAKWLDYVDLASLTNFYIVQEVMDNYESFHGSCYLHRDIDNADLSADGQATHKWHFGPVWDFGSSLNDEKSRYIYEGRPWHQVWIGEMCTFPDFMNAVKTRWMEFYPSQYGNIDGFIDDFVSRVAAAAAADAKRWPQYGNADILSDAVAVKAYLARSTDWLCQRWGRSSSIADISSTTVNVNVVSGRLVITAPRNMTVTVARIDGTVFTLNAVEGTNVFDLPHGFYVVEGKKICL